MTDEIVFYHNPESRAAIARRMLEEVGAPYRIELLRLDRGEQKQEQYLRLNPMGKVPAIVHRGVVVTEAAAICAYLADAFPQAKLAPALDDPQRGTYYRWLFFGAGCIEPAFTDRLQQHTPGRPSGVGYGSHADVVRALSTAVEAGPFLLGEQFTAADVYVSSQIGWGAMVNALEMTPVLTAYVERCNQRPAARRARELDQALSAQLH